MADEHIARIRELNDALRTKGHANNGRVVAGSLTQDSRKKHLRVLEAVARFDKWDDGDYPYGERDFGNVDVNGEAFIWKIDYTTTAWMRCSVPSTRTIRR